MIQEWEELLNPGFEKIKDEFFKENWFLEKDEKNKKIEFGNKNDHYFTIYFMSPNYFIVSGYRFNTPKELSFAVIDILAENLKGYDVLIQGAKLIATGEKSDYIKEILEYLDGTVFKDRSLRLPIYSAIPEITYDECIFMLDDKRTLSRKIRSLIEAKNFHEGEQKELEKMKETEKEIHQFIVRNEPEIRIHQNDKYEETPFYLSEKIQVKFSFSKRTKASKFIYQAHYTCGDEWKKYEDESLENVLDYTKKEIINYVSNAG